VVLTDALQIEQALDLGRFGDMHPAPVFPPLRGQFLIKDLFAENNAIIADIDAGTGDQFFDFGMGFTAKAAEGDIGGSGHLGYSGLSAKLVARSSRPGISLRDCTTSSTKP